MGTSAFDQLWGSDSVTPRVSGHGFAGQPPERTALSPEQETAYQAWLRRYQITDADRPGSNYDYRGAFLTGLTPDTRGHWSDQFKQHGEPTFSEESQYSAGPGDGGTWQGEQFRPPAAARAATFDSLWGTTPAPAHFGDVTGGASTADQPGPIERALRNQYDLLRGEVNAAYEFTVGTPAHLASLPFQPQSRAERESDLANAYAIGKGILPPPSMTPEPPPAPGQAEPPGLAAQLPALARGFIPDPLAHLEQLWNAPDAYTAGGAAVGLGGDVAIGAGLGHGIAGLAEHGGAVLDAARPGPADGVARETPPATFDQAWETATPAPAPVAADLLAGRAPTEGLGAPLPGPEQPEPLPTASPPAEALAPPEPPPDAILAPPVPVPPVPAASRPTLGPPIDGPIGGETQVMVHQGQAFPARYRVVEADALRSSHDPFTFAPTEGYPAGIQGRDYQRNQAAQETVRARALDFNAEMALNPSTSATEGQPTILPDGTVLAGNERSMHPRLAAELAPEKYAAYRRALEQRAPQFGLDPLQVAGMQRPVLVRELTSIADLYGGPPRWAEINRLSDVTATKAKSLVEEGAARAQALQGAGDALRHFGETIGADETVSQYLGTAHGRTFVKQLLDHGVITKEELGRFTSGEGALTTDGREAIRQMLLGTAVREPAALLDAPPLVVAKLEHAIPNIVGLRGTPFDASGVVTAALRALGDARQQGLTLTDYGGQGDLLGGAPSLAREPLVLQFAGFLEHSSKLGIAQAFRRYATLAREAIAAGGSVDMFGGTGWDPPRAFREAFGLPAEFKAALGGPRRPGRSAPGELSLFGQEEHGGFFSPTGAEGPVGSRPAGFADALQQQRAEPARAPMPAGRPYAQKGSADYIPTVQVIQWARDYAGPAELRARAEAQRSRFGGDSAMALEVTARNLLLEVQNSGTPGGSDLLTRRGKFSPEEVAARPEAVQSEELAGRTEHAPGQHDIFAIGMGARRQAAPAEVGGPIVEALRARHAGAGPTTPDGTPLPEPGGTLGRTLPSVREFTEGVQSLLAADTVSEAAAGTASVVRAQNARRAHAVAQAEATLKAAGRYAATLPRAAQFALDDAIEHGRPLADPQQAALAEGLRTLLDTEAARIQALGTGKLQQLIEHYLPHIWTDPEAAARVIGQMSAKRPFKGSQSFTKHRTIATMREGLEAGLTPVTYNPVELALLKFREMRRFRMAVQIMKLEKANGRLVFVKATASPGPLLKRVDDPAFTVFGPPEVPIKEGFDAGVRDQLNAVIRSLPGLRHQRTPKLAIPSALGYATGPEGNFMASKFGTESVVIMHELGHILDFRYGLWDRLVEPAPRESHTYTKGKRAGQTVERGAKQEAGVVQARQQIKEELRALADLRWEGQAPSGYYKAYVRDKYEQIANAVHALIYAPEKMQRVAPTVKAKLTRFLQSDPKLAKVLEITPSLRVESASASQKLPGFPLLGHYYAEAPVARILNNFLSPGLRGKALYDAYMGAGNTLNQAQLGLSAFHLGFTSFDVATSKLALGIEQARAGRPVAAIRSALEAPLAPIMNALRGLRVKHEYLRPGAAPEMAGIVRALDAAGGRVVQEAVYRNSSVPRFLEAIRGGAYGRAALHVLPAIIEAAAAPIFEHIVPAQKLGVFADLAAFELSRLPKDVSRAEYRQAMGRVWDSVDNRLGMMVYDNLFWHKTFKDMTHATVRAVGWNVGTIRELGGGAADLARGRLTHRAAYLIALPMMVGMAGSVITYLYTGAPPQDLKDAFWPRTGRKDKDGNDERIQLPSYMKDLVGFARHPVQTAEHKLHPLIGLVADMLSNTDFYGDQIRNPHDPFVRQLQQEATYLLQAITPLGVRNARQESRQTGLTKALNFVGITPAPRELVRSPAQNYMGDILSRGGGGATPEEKDTRQRRRAVADAYRGGQLGVEQVTDSMRAGAITPTQRRQMIRQEGEPPYVTRFRQLSWSDAEQVYARANARERATWWPLLVRKRLLALRQLSVAGIHDERTQALLSAAQSGRPDGPPGQPIADVGP